jgi:pimeloyl-ACP methyl ester carboxylesterase
MKLLAIALLAVIASISSGAGGAQAPDDSSAGRAADSQQIHYRTTTIDGVEVFYREAGDRAAPTVLLLHGFPTSSHMFRDLIPRLADRYHVVAPDYPGYGYSGAPDHAAFAYTFDHYAKIVDALAQQIGLTRYAIYVMDYGAPVGFRLATMHPERVSAFLVQNGNAYEEGIGKFWDPIKAYWKTGAPAEREGIRWLTSSKATQWQYFNGVKDASLVSPDAPKIDQDFLDRPGNQEIQLDLLYDYRTNIPLYPGWQAYFRKYKPPMLIVWGRNDEIFIAPGAAPYKRDIPNAEVHMLDTGHFALETNGVEMAALIRDFLGRNLSTPSHRP